MLLIGFALLISLFIGGGEKRGYRSALLSLLLSVPLGVFFGVLSTSTICGHSSTTYCGYNIYLTVPITVIFGYFMLLVVGTYIMKLQRHTPYEQSAVSENE